MDNKVLPDVQRRLWKRLAGVDELSPFYLADGTAIALHRQHRESIDFDFFNPSTFSTELLLDKLETVGSLKVLQLGSDTVLGTLEEVKVSFFRYPYRLLRELRLVEGIQVAELDDLAVMKLVAIAQRGTKKDFIDMHELLSSGYSLGKIFSLAEKKLAGVAINEVHYLKSLTYFADAESDPMPKMLKSLSWRTVKKSLRDAALDYIG